MFYPYETFATSFVNTILWTRAVFGMKFYSVIEGMMDSTVHQWRYKYYFRFWQNITIYDACSKLFFINSWKIFKSLKIQFHKLFSNYKRQTRLFITQWSEMIWEGSHKSRCDMVLIMYDVTYKKENFEQKNCICF